MIRFIGRRRRRAPLAAAASRRAHCALILGLAALSGAPLASAHDAAAPPTHAHAFEAPASGPPLSIGEAVRLALTDQPLLRQREASIEADEQQAVAAAQLPDPRLTAGIRDLPVDRGEAFSFREDDFTMLTLGLSQDFPRANKRRLKSERKRLEADVDRYGLETDRRSVGRDAALAWLDAYESEQGLELVRQLAAEASLQVGATESAHRNGRAAQADLLAARVEAQVTEDKAQEWRHHVERMRAALSRWIGGEAQRPLADELSALPAPTAFAGLMTAVDGHPAVAGLQKQIEAAEKDVALAHQAYKPDAAVEAYFGYRQAYADFAGIQVSMDLPFFVSKRQDRELAAALRQADAVQERKADLLRQLRAEATEDYIDWHHARERVEAFERDIIPQAQRRVEAAQSAYAAGRGAFDALLMARRSVLDTRLQRLALTLDAARAQVRLQYFSTAGADR